MCYILLSFTLNVTASFYLYAGKYGEENDVQKFSIHEKKNIRTATEIKLRVSKKYIYGISPATLAVFERQNQEQQ